MKHAHTGKTIKINAPESKFNPGYLAFSIIVALILVAPLLYVYHRSDRDQFVSVSWLPGSLPIAAAILLVLAALLAWGIYLLMLNYPHFAYKHHKYNPMPRLSLEMRPGSVFATAFIIFAFWMPVLVLFYPCATNHDFINQVYQYQASAPTWYTTLGTTIDAEFIDHHPVFDTLVYGWFMQLGDTIGSQNAGMFIFIIIQSFLLALTLAASVCYLELLDLPKVLRIAALAFAIFFPYYAPYAACAMKDTLYVIAFTPFFLLYLETYRTGGDSLRHPGFLIAFVLAMGMCILTKKLGVYICLASMLVMFLTLKGVRIRALAVPLASILVFSLAFPAVVYPAIGGVAPGGRQESLCFAIQQTATLLVKKPEAVSAEDLAIIDKVLDVDAAKADYKPALADGAKNRFRDDCTDEELQAYLGVWVKEGIQNPKEYALSLAQCSGQMLIPSKQLSYHYTISDADHLKRWGERFNEVSDGYHMELERPAILAKATHTMRDVLLVYIGKVPVVNLITTIALYGSWIPFLCVAITFMNRKREVLALAPIMWTVFTLVISPGSLGRYVLCLMFAIIAMAGWALYSFDQRKKVKSSDRDKPASHAKRETNRS